MPVKMYAAAVLTAVLAVGVAAIPESASAPASVSVSASVSAQRFTYLDLFPFKNLGQARAWEAAYRSGGHAPWHLSAGLTALAFTRGYLGFPGINKITSKKVHGSDAHIGVGFRNPAGRLSTSAVLHLRKLGTGTDAPWEVVGSDDTSLSITRPGYGAYVTGKVKAGGRITGVDESLRLWVRGLSSSRPLGQACCVAAGGVHRPWTATVKFRHGTDRVLTVVVATGGHVAPIERFALTGIRTG